MENDSKSKSPYSAKVPIEEADGLKFVRFRIPSDYQGHTFALDILDGTTTGEVPTGPYRIKFVLTSEFLIHLSSADGPKCNTGFSHILVSDKLAQAKVKFLHLSGDKRDEKREGTLQLEATGGRLCAINISLPETDLTAAVTQAGQIISACLDVVTLRTCVPLQVRDVEVTSVREPNFLRRYVTFGYSDVELQERDLLDAPSVPGRLNPAMRLFREAINASKPHYRLLCLYRAREALMRIQKGNDQTLAKKGVQFPRPARRVPDNVATRSQFAPLIGKKVGALFDFVRDGFRLPIAHGNRSVNDRLELDPADVRTDHRVDAANAIMIQLIREAINDEMMLMRRHSIS
jgi:hypothetical protein